MRSFLRSVLAFFRPGATAAKSDAAPADPADVTLHVPGMH